MIHTQLRVIVVDDERPARAYLSAALATAPDVVVVGEAASGADAVALIQRTRPDLAFLDVQMPEMQGLAIPQAIPKARQPLFIFVTAHDEHAAGAFGLHAVDYLLKPVEPARLREALQRAHDRLDRADVRERRALEPRRSGELSPATPGSDARIDRIPVRQKDDIVLVPVPTVASVIADGELLHITTVRNERHTITYRLKDLEARLDPRKFVRLGRGAIANIEAIARVTPMPGGTYTVTLQDGRQLDVSRMQSRHLRQRLLRL